MRRNTYPTSGAFTLVELLVSMTIFGIIMISVLSIFLFSSQMSARVELNRMMQENMKNILEDIAEGVRKEGITGVRSYGDTGCSVYKNSGSATQSAVALCIADKQYILGKRNADGLSFSPAEGCATSPETCYMLRKIGAGDWQPMSNSFISFQSVDFQLSNPILPRLTIRIQARPAYGKGIATQQLENTSFSIQTSLSERLIKTQ